MGSQTPINYYAMFAAMVKRHNELAQQRNALDIEVAKLKQLIAATFPLIPEEKQQLFQAQIDAMEEQSASLLKAVKLVFNKYKEEWITPVQVRDHLTAIGFDLTQYKANPLASIATTLRRMVPSDLESRRSADGQVLYRRSATPLERIDDSIEDALKQTFKKPYGPTVPPPPGAVPEAGFEDFKLGYGYPDPLNQRGKKK